MLVAGHVAEIGTQPAMSVAQTEQLCATPWLEGGTDPILECGSEMADHGFARPTHWKGTDSIRIVLTLRRGSRDRETYDVMTDRSSCIFIRDTVPTRIPEPRRH